MTHLTVSIFVQSLTQALADTAKAKALGADWVEFRIDLFADDPQLIQQLVEQSALPCILTCRPTWEGGQYDGDDQNRISLLQQACLGDFQPAYVDMELAAYQRSANLRQKVNLVVEHPGQVRPVATGLILSSHDFESRPIDLYQRIEAMVAASACRVIKVAWSARSLRDNLEAFELLSQRHKPTIALCMGELGLFSRVLAKKFGSVLTFAALDKENTTAPGQPTIDELKNLYRWDALDAQTQVFGVIGCPVAHSMSPAIHNCGFDVVNYNGVYLPMPIAPEYEPFKATVDAFLQMQSLHFRGASVTIPHKQNLLRFVQEMQGNIQPLAKTIGAANTLTVRDDGSLYASNTDYQAALDAVCDALQCQVADLADKQVAVIGAGGVARAVVAGFAHHGARVMVYNRTLEKAEQLAEAINGNQAANPTSDQSCPAGKVIALPLDQLGQSSCQIYINCTSVGMFPHVDQSPMALDQTSASKHPFGPGIVVFDTIYSPMETKLLRDARQGGCLTISGADMFVRQAAAQFELWTGQKAPMDAFRKIIEQKLRSM